MRRVNHFCNGQTTATTNIAKTTGQQRSQEIGRRMNRDDGANRQRYSAARSSTIIDVPRLALPRSGLSHAGMRGQTSARRRTPIWRAMRLAGLPPHI